MMSYLCKISKNLLFVSVLLFAFACSKKESSNSVCHLNASLKSKKYDEVCFLMTHNAMNNIEKGYSVPNQSLSVTNQLNNCVRGLMIDTYDGDNGIALTYHAVPIFGQQKLVDVLQEVKDF